MRRKILATLAVAAAMFALLSPTPAASRRSGWKPAGRLIVAVRSGNAFALADGRVVSVAMRIMGDSWPATTQVWNPANQRWTAAGAKPIFPKLVQGAAIRLDDGRILVTGYCRKDCGAGSNAELYDPATDRWSMPGQMRHGRYFHSMAKLRDGRVLVLGGCTRDSCFAGTRVVEVFDPKSGRFATLAAPMPVRRVCFTATTLADGRVLVAGGYNPKGVLRENEIYDAARDLWTFNAPMTHAHVVHAAILLKDERVLVAGGDCLPGLPCAEADVFNPRRGNWKSAGAMSAPRSGLAAVVLQGGEALICGGLTYFGTLWRNLETCEAFDPDQNAFVPEDSMSAARADFSFAMLSNGKVLAVGGDQWPEGEDKTPGTSELYTP
ncbi:MAG TPA: kelch repeat-containing protein [Rhizomicrobium sp.]|nr:kelch repeat-containing protein [Rhizomicrobium sp.]